MLDLDPELIERFEEIERLLDATYGPRILRESDDPLTSLIGTILSQNTSDVNTARSMASLREAFPTWKEVAEADTTEVAESIKSGGLSNIKAPRIQKVISEVVERTGSTDLCFLRDMPQDEAMTWLTSMNGVGPKTAACVLLFSLGMPAMPVDTHVGRVMTRLGIVPDRTSTDTKQRILEELIGPDPDRVYAVHVETIEHGRRICQSRRPKCEQCPLTEHCLYYEEHFS